MSERSKRPLAGGKLPSRTATKTASRPAAERAPTREVEWEAEEVEGEPRPSPTRRFVSENLWRSGEAPKASTGAKSSGQKAAGVKSGSAKEKILRALKKLHPME